MKKMLRTFMLFLIALSLAGAGAGQTFAQVTKHSVSAEFVEITICTADQSPQTILIDRNGNKIPEPVQCDCPNCVNCLTGSAFELPNIPGAVKHNRTAILTIIPLPFNLTGADLIAPAMARAPPHKV